MLFSSWAAAFPLFLFPQSLQGGGPWPIVHSLPTGGGGGVGQRGDGAASPAALPSVERDMGGMLHATVRTRQSLLNEGRWLFALKGTETSGRCFVCPYRKEETIQPFQ